MIHAAAAPPASTMIHTPATGLDAGYSHMTVQGFALPFYYAAPAGGKNLPVLLVVQEIFGLHEHIADVCRRLAHQGYLAIAPELYARQGDPRAYTDIPQLVAELVSQVPDAQVLGDLDAALAWAGAHGGDLSHAGITGFCWGGRITWLYCAHSAQVRAGVAWYGRLQGPGTVPTPRHPVDMAASLQVPVLGLYGGEDAGIPLTQVEAMRAALQAAGAAGTPAAAASSIAVYPQAPHAFYADYRPSFRPDLAQAGFGQMLAWFKDKGVA